MKAITVMVDGCLSMNEAMNKFNDLLKNFEDTTKEICADGEG